MCAGGIDGKLSGQYLKRRKATVHFLLPCIPFLSSIRIAFHTNLCYNKFRLSQTNGKNL